MTALTFLEPVKRHCPARKRHQWVTTAAGTRLETTSYGKASLFHFLSDPVADIEDLFASLERRSRFNCFAIRGQVKPDIAPGTPIKRRYKGDDAAIIDAPSRIISVDLDQEAPPDWLDTDDIKAVGDYLRGRLPPELQPASCVVQLSAGYGLSRWTGKPPLLKARLWFINATALDSAALRAWFRAMNATGKYAVMDDAVAGCNQPIYTAAPIFEGMADPVLERLYLLLGEADEADIQPPKVAPRQAAPAFTGPGERCPERLAVCVAMIHAAKDGEKHTVLNRAAYLAGGLVAGGACTLDEARAALREAIAAKTGVENIEAAYQTIEAGLQDGIAAPIGVAPEVSLSVALSEKSDFDGDLAKLAAAPGAQARATAKAILNRYSWRCPWKMSFEQLATRVCEALPPEHPANLEDWITRRVEWLKREALKTAREQSSLDRGVLQRAGVDVVDVASIEEARALVESDHAPLWLVKADLGTGKTEKILKLLSEAAHRVVAITHRVSLVDDLALRLQLENYKELRAKDAEYCEQLALCLNSITNQKFSVPLGRAETALVDEISAVCREAHNPAGTLGKGAKPTWERLIGLLDRARVACGVDADLSTKDALTLAKAIERPVRVIQVASEAKPLEATIGSYQAVWQQALACAAAGIPFRVATDSAKQVRKLEAAIKAQSPHLRVMAIHSTPGVATSGDDAVKSLLANINAEVRNIDVLIHSPCVESGVSLTVPRFSRTFGIYCGAVSPAAFIQMLRRDRTATRFEIGVLNNGIRFEETDAGIILANLEAAHRATSGIARHEGGYQLKITPTSPWDLNVAEYRAMGARATNRYAQALAMLFEARHQPVSLSQARGVSPIVLEAANIVSARNYRLAIEAAPDITADQREQLNQVYQPSPEQSAEMARFDLKQTLAIKDVDREALDIWGEGDVRRRVERFEILMSAPLQGLVTDIADDAAAIPLAARSNRLAKAEAYRLAFEVLEVDLVTGEASITAESAMEAFKTLEVSTARPALEASGICRFAKPPKYAVRWVSDLLERFGLRLVEGMRTRANGRTRVYSISSETKRGLPGWREMLAIVARRATVPDGPVKTYRTASGTRTETTQP